MALSEALFLWYCFNAFFSHDQLIFTVSDSGSGKSSSLPCLQKHFFHFSIKAQSHNIAQMERSLLTIYWENPTSGRWGCPGRTGWREHRRGDQPPPPPQPAPESITICWSDKFSQAECRLLLLWRPRKFFGGKKEKNEKTSPSWGGQGGGLPLLEPGQLGPALNNNLCCKIEEIIYETRVQYSKRNLPQTPHDEAWKEGM